MKSTLILVLLSVLSLRVQAQAPQDISYYLSHPQIYAPAKDYYTGKYKASDDSLTFSIIDNIHTKNNSTRPFYILLVSMMLEKSDGALGEPLGMMCVHFVETRPNEAVEFLYSNASLVKSEFKNDWAGAIAGEFMIACEGKEKSCIKKWLNKAMKKVDKKNRQNLQALADNVESLIKP